jgi:hypothetical protein
MPVYDLQVEPRHVKAEAQRRIEGRYPVWKQMNALAAGGDPEMTAFINGIRTASNALEAMTPIPPNYADDRHWETTP